MCTLDYNYTEISSSTSWAQDSVYRFRKAIHVISIEI